MGAGGSKGIGGSWINDNQSLEGKGTDGATTGRAACGGLPKALLRCDEVPVPTGIAARLSNIKPASHPFWLRFDCKPLPPPLAGRPTHQSYFHLYTFFRTCRVFVVYPKQPFVKYLAVHLPSLPDRPPCSPLFQAIGEDLFTIAVDQPFR